MAAALCSAFGNLRVSAARVRMVCVVRWLAAHCHACVGSRFFRGWRLFDDHAAAAAAQKRHGWPSRLTPCHPDTLPLPTAQAPRPFTAAKSLSSKSNGMAAAPRVTLVAQQQQRVQQPAALVVECADGRRGGKLKTRKVRQGSGRSRGRSGFRQRVGGRGVGRTGLRQRRRGGVSPLATEGRGSGGEGLGQPSVRGVSGQAAGGLRAAQLEGSSVSGGSC